MNRNELDHRREGRTNVPEVVFASGKDDEALLGAVRGLVDSNGRVLVTKLDKGQLSTLRANFSDKLSKADGTAGVAVIGGLPEKYIGKVAVLAAGSSDYFVSEEAALSCEFFGLEVFRFYDCGVAGVHRLDGPLKEIEEKDVDAIVVVAGMEGALPSLVAGLVKPPVIAVPTSVGYGTGMDGLPALLAMLNSCAPGIAVMNIDNGFGAAALALKMIRWMRR